MRIMLITIVLIFLVLITVSAWCACVSRPYDPMDDADQMKYMQEWSATKKARQTNRKRRLHHDRNN